jgi:hypothetical protein
MTKQITIDLDAINRELADELRGHAQQLQAQANNAAEGVAGMEHFAGIDIIGLETEFCAIAPQAVSWGNRLISMFGWISPTNSAKLRAFLNVVQRNVIAPVCSASDAGAGSAGGTTTTAP